MRPWSTPLRLLGGNGRRTETWKQDHGLKDIKTSLGGRYNHLVYNDNCNSDDFVEVLIISKIVEQSFADHRHHLDTT